MKGKGAFVNWISLDALKDPRIRSQLVISSKPRLGSIEAHGILQPK